MAANRPSGLVVDQSEDGVFVLFNGRVYLIEDRSTPRGRIQKGQMVYVTITEEGTISDLERSETIENRLEARLEGNEILINVHVTQRNTYKFPYLDDEDNHFTLNTPEGFHNCTAVLSFALDQFNKEVDLDERNCVAPRLLSKSVKEIISKYEGKITEVPPWIMERRKLDYQNNTLINQRDVNRVGIVVAACTFDGKKGERAFRSFLWNLKFGAMPIRTCKGKPLPKIGETYTFFTQVLAGQICAVKLDPAAKAVDYRISSFTEDKMDIHIMLPVTFPKKRKRPLRWEDDFYGKFYISSADLSLKLLHADLKYSDLAGKTVDLVFSFADPHRREDQEYQDLFHWELQGIAKQYSPTLSSDNGPRHSRQLPSLLNIAVPPPISRAESNHGPSRGRNKPQKQECHHQHQSGYSNVRGQAPPQHQFARGILPPPTNQTQYVYNRGPNVNMNQQNQAIVIMVPLTIEPTNQKDVEQPHRGQEPKPAELLVEFYTSDEEEELRRLAASKASKKRLC